MCKATHEYMYDKGTLFLKFSLQQNSHIICTATAGSKSTIIIFFPILTSDQLLFKLFHFSLKKNELSNRVQLLMNETPLCILSANSFFAFSNPDLPFPIMKY